MSLNKKAVSLIYGYLLYLENRDAILIYNDVRKIAEPDVAKAHNRKSFKTWYYRNKIISRTYGIIKLYEKKSYEELALPLE